MRLICPNCGAQYEVDDSLVPDSGRDVQCSNCGHAWFQRPAHLDESPAPEPVGAAPGQPWPEDPDLGDYGQPQAAAAARVDPAVREILRDEAEREIRARQAAAPVETQDELGLEEDQRSAALRERMARLRGVDVDERAESAAVAVAAATAAGSRRDLLPDIEEINSSLRSAEERSAALPDESAPRRRGGFGFGFSLVLVLALLAIAAYAFADRIGTAVPALKPALTAYVAWADAARAWLDGRARALIDAIRT